MIRPRRRGVYAIFMALTLSALIALSRDPIIAAAASALIAALTFDTIVLAYKLRGRCRVEPETYEVRLLLGEEKVLEAGLACRGSRVEFNSNIVDAELGDGKVKLRVKGSHVGLYDVEGGRLWVNGPLGLLEAPVRLDLKFKVKVVPRVVYAILEALEALRGAGVGAGEFLSMLLGRRGEYLYSREYVPGDDLKTADWKATARSLKLMVKTFSREESSGVGGLYVDTKCFGEYSCDGLATSLLTVALASRSLGGKMRVYDVERGELLELDPEGLIAYSISKILESEIADELSIYEFAGPLTRSEISKLLRAHIKTKRAKLSELSEVEGLLIAVSTTLANVDSLLETIETLGGDSVILLTHSKPWLDAGSLEEAYVIHETHEKVCGKLRGLGVRVIYCCPFYSEEAGALS